LIIGLTGGIGAGKSLISKILEVLSYPVFNSDLEAKFLVENNAEIKSKIVALLGENSYKKEGYNSTFVAEVVFHNEEKLKQLNEIIHPAVRSAFAEFARKNQSNLTFNEAAILFETGAHKSFDKTILICADQDIRIGRILKRGKLSVEDIQGRLEKQWMDSKKRKLADFVIENNGKESVLIQINNVLEKLNKQTVS
jgi:dephospho-CoA kinase